MINPDHINKIAIAPRPLSRLTYKILGINVITIVVLAMSFSYITQTRENLIRNEVDNFETESRMYAVILNKNLTADQTNLQQLQTILSDLNMHTGQQANLYTENGIKILSNGNIPERKTFREVHDKNLNLLMRTVAAIENWVSVNFRLPPFPGANEAFTADIPKIEQTIDGLNIAAWSAPDGGLVLSAHINLVQNKLNISNLQLIRRDMQIEDSFVATRVAVTRFALISLTMTIAFSLYLAGLIGHPLRNLATAAESFRVRRGKNIEIPDLSYRNDEIGELSRAMREMTHALRNRLTAIEQFAADVAHELKNPITSMKSAVETLPKVKAEEDRTKLINIILHDLQRMNRLISDISQASRLDAELSRDVLEPLDIRTILNPLIDIKSDPRMRAEDEQKGHIVRQGFDTELLVMGQGGRLAQVFDNLISNALSFSVAGTPVIVSLQSAGKWAKIIVEDNGMGIPESRLEKIFDRFYSERPVSEDFGMHSGLGLSIAKQIVESHGGTIYAENRKNEQGGVIGARFVVKLTGIQK